MGMKMKKERYHFYKKELVKKFTPEDFKRNFAYWNSRKAKARKEIRKVALVGCPIFMTCSPEMNKAMESKAKEKLEWAKDEIKFADNQIKDLKRLRKVV